MDRPIPTKLPELRVFDIGAVFLFVGYTILVGVAGFAVGLFWVGACA
jgi:hypothetical protein